MLKLGVNGSLGVGGGCDNKNFLGDEGYVGGGRGLVGSKRFRYNIKFNLVYVFHGVNFLQIFST